MFKFLRYPPHLKQPTLYLLDRRFSMAASTSPGPVESSIHEKLTLLLRPTSMTISNESSQHRHHAAMREQGSNNGETHFSVVVVSDGFKGKNTMQRHRMIYSALSEEFSQGLHALSLKTKTPEEAEAAVQTS